MDISGFLNQTASYEAKTAQNEFSDNTYAAPITIPVRTTIKHKLSIKTRHESYIAVTEHMTTHPINIGDRINGEVIRAVETMPDFDGTIIGYLAMPRPPVGFAN